MATLKANWTNKNTEALVFSIVDEINQHGRGTSGFGSPAWNRILATFNSSNIRDEKRLYNAQQLQSKFKELKKDYKLFKNLINLSGNSLDVNGLPLLHPDVWKKEGAQKFSKKPLENMQELEYIFCENSFATGAHSKHSVGVRLAKDIEIKESADENVITIDDGK